ncbi:MAG TPA: ABC transporter permease, partial [Acidimicrobiales bacterium]|nr:ABC transporter permease [Acidimicrobiales bacterium]
IVGVVTGGGYALLAVSITLMYRSTGFLSFAHAGFATVAAYVYADLAGSRAWPAVVAAGVAVGITVVYGVLVERVLRPVRNSPAATKMIATLGIVQLSTALVLLVYGFQPTSAPLLLPDGAITIGDLRIGHQQSATLALAAGSAAALGWFLRATRFGTAIRAVASNPEAARLMGVSITHVGRFNWALGSALAGIAGVLLAPLSPINAGTFTLFLAKALVATLVGGLMSLPLTFVGALGLGVADSITVFNLSAPGAKELVTLLLVVVLLFARRSWPADLPPTVETTSRRVNPLVQRLTPIGRSISRGAWSLRWPAAAVGAVLLVAVPAGSNYWGFVGARGLFFTIQALSLVLLVGWGGQVSLMHGAYVGIGAFTTALLVDTHGWPLEFALLGGGVAGVAMGAVVGVSALRLSGLQFAIASLVFSGAASEWLFRRTEFPKSMPRGTLFGVDIFPDSNLYYFMLPATVLLYVAVWNVRRSTFGALLISARDAPTTVAHFGADPSRTRMWAFLLASFIAALGGGFYGVLLTGFQPFDFSLILSIALLVYAVVGGVQSLAGPLLAGLMFGVVPQLIQGESSTAASAVPDLIAGIAVLALVALRPGGLASLFGAPTRGSADAEPRSFGRFDVTVTRWRARHEVRPAASPSEPSNGTSTPEGEGAVQKEEVLA